jgi:hypothetical protein
MVPLIVFSVVDAVVFGTTRGRLVGAMVGGSLRGMAWEIGFATLATGGQWGSNLSRSSFVMVVKTLDMSLMTALAHFPDREPTSGNAWIASLLGPRHCSRTLF